jgi:hypothetical protein
MNNVIDAVAQSPPLPKSPRPQAKVYLLLPLGLGEVAELTNSLVKP